MRTCVGTDTSIIINFNRNILDSDEREREFQREERERREKERPERRAELLTERKEAWAEARAREARAAEAAAHERAERAAERAEARAERTQQNQMLMAISAPCVGPSGTIHPGEDWELFHALPPNEAPQGTGEVAATRGSMRFARLRSIRPRRSYIAYTLFSNVKTSIPGFGLLYY